MVKLIFNPKDSYVQKELTENNLNPFKNEEITITPQDQTFLHSKDIVGLENCHYILKDWFNDPSKNNKSLMIIGPVGCGKTSLIDAFCREENINVYNVKHNDKTKKDLIRELVSFCQFSSFFVKETKRKLIFIDEYQNGTNDILSISDIETLLTVHSLNAKEKSAFFGQNISITIPPILIVSGDSRGSKLNDLKKISQICYINEIPQSLLKQWVKSFSSLTEAQINHLVDTCKSDKRLLLTNLSCNNLSFYKDTEQTAFEIIEKLFDNLEPMDINDIYKMYETDGFTLSNLIHENYIDFSNDIDVIANCAESISFGETIFSDTYESTKNFLPEAHCTNAVYIPSWYLKSDKPTKNIRTSCINNRYNIYLNNKKLTDRIGLGIMDILYLKKLINGELVKKKVLSEHNQDFLRNILGSLENNIDKLELIYKHFSEFKETGVVKTKNFTLKFKEKLKLLNGAN